MSDDSSIKPYLIRAVHQWCTDSDYSLYISVLKEGCSGIPDGLFKNGEIILNISHQATKDLLINNEIIQFVTRFNRVPTKVEVMLGAVVAVFSKESGQGLTFTPDINKRQLPEQQENNSDYSALLNNQILSDEDGRGKSFLRVVK